MSNNKEETKIGDEEFSAFIASLPGDKANQGQTKVQEEIEEYLGLDQKMESLAIFLEEYYPNVESFSVNTWSGGRAFIKPHLINICVTLHLENGINMMIDIINSGYNITQGDITGCQESEKESFYDIGNKTAEYIVTHFARNTL